MVIFNRWSRQIQQLGNWRRLFHPWMWSGTRFLTLFYPGRYIFGVEGDSCGISLELFLQRNEQWGIHLFSLLEDSELEPDGLVTENSFADQWTCFLTHKSIHHRFGFNILSGARLYWLSACNKDANWKSALWNKSLSKHSLSKNIDFFSLFKCPLLS